MMHFRTVAAILAVAAAHAVPVAFAQSSDPAWLDAVKAQMARDEQCEVELFLNMREGQLGGQNFYETRVQCRDGRQFDATRTEPDKIFTIRACEVVVC